MSSRKLQQEFDKLQKKVGEGLASFEEIYEKIGITENSSLKEKLEGDLRKEIKKLQRSRDQVKQWSGDSSNKLDKEVLLDTRSRIENAMERFKEVEKVSKMKQFSNEGLELQTKLGARGLDEARKNEAAKYIVEVLEELKRQNELLSGEMGQYSHRKKSSAAQSALADLSAKSDRNNSHISRLELVLRNLENYRLEPEKVDEIKDDLDYYVENNQSPDFVEYDDFYDLLELDESLEVVPPTHVDPPAPTSSQAQTQAQAQPHSQSQSQQPSNTSAHSSPKKSAAVSTGGSGGATDTKASQDSKVKTTDSKGTDTKTEVKAAKAPEHPRVTITIGNSITPSSSQNGANTAPASASSSSSSSSASAPNSNVPPTSAPATSSAPVSSSRAPPPGLNPQSKPGTPVQTPVKLTVAEELKKKAMTHAAAAASAIKSPATKPAQAVATPAAASAASAAAAAESSRAVSTAVVSSPSPSPVLPKDRKDSKVAAFWDNSANVAALAQSRLNNPLPFQAISQQLEASLLNCPDSFDSERPRQYNPTNVHPSSVDYPQEPMFELNSATIMRKFDTDTLFFCFYYNENQDALAKWNAARELSRRGWVFNSNTKQWFSKEERPKSRSILGGLQNGEKESSSASYKYFDYESSWLVRRKDNFVFDRDAQRTF
ncbi:hypothetical protein JCM33374_g3216 [Metschnikowia sp. JCM 33374]|nr:hypothetical protein JCM33374_g3216 [Metschnikowia sp. JCM 33374]